jgi:hypothetical protein
MFLGMRRMETGMEMDKETGVETGMEDLSDSWMLEEWRVRREEWEKSVEGGVVVERLKIFGPGGCRRRRYEAEQDIVGAPWILYHVQSERAGALVVPYKALCSAFFRCQDASLPGKDGKNGESGRLWQ